LSIKVSLLGTSPTSVLANTVGIEQLIKIDTMPNATRSTTAPISPTEKDQWLDTDTNELFIYLNGTWKLLYTTIANDTDLGYVNGAFHFSSFTDITVSGVTYKAGFINFQSISHPVASSDINKGVSIAYQNGFGFSIDNNHPDYAGYSNKFWSFVINSKLVLYGAKISLYTQYAGNTILQMTGVNRKNSFNYTDYEFEVDSLLVQNNLKFPNTYIDSALARYAKTRTELLNKPSYVTYGEWENMALQNISSLITYQSVTPKGSSATVKNITGKLTSLTTILFYTADIVASNGFPLYISPAELISKITSDPSNYVVIITKDTTASSQNLKLKRTITAISDNPGTGVTITLNASLITSAGVGAQIGFYITEVNYAYQINDDDDNSYGFKLPDTAPLNIKQFNTNEQQFISISGSGFEENAEKNKITMYAEDAVDLTNVTLYKKLEFDIPIIDKDLLRLETVSNTYTYDGVGYVIHSANSAVTNTGNAKFTSFAYPSIVIYSQSSKSNIGANGEINSEVEVYRYQNAAYGDKHPLVFGTSLPINHANDSFILDKKNVRLCMDFSVKLSFKPDHKYTALLRRYGIGYKIQIRFRKFDGSYVTDSTSLLKEVPLGHSSVLPSEPYTYRINNFPDGDRVLGGFGTTGTTPPQIYKMNVVTSGNTASLNSIFSTLRYGDIVYDTSTNKFKRKSWEYSSAYEDLTSPYHPVANDKILMNNTVYTYNGSALVSGVSATSFPIPVLKGQNLFPLDALVDGGETADWNEIEALEILILVDAPEKIPLYIKPDGSLDLAIAAHPSLYHLFECTITNHSQPAIYISDTFDLKDKILFSDGGGRELSGNRTSLKHIVTDVMNDMYGADNWDSTSLDTLFTYYTRLNFGKFRKQFLNQIQAEEVLAEIMRALWACIIVDKNNKLKFKTISEDDYSSTVFNFTQANIINDTVVRPSFRRVEDIYQNFIFKYDETPASIFFNTIEKFKSQLTYNADNSETPFDISSVLNQTKYYYNANNELIFELPYHYQKPDNVFLKNIIQHFIFNAWTISFSVSIDPFYLTTPIELLDYVSLTLDYYSDGAVLKGFVTDIKPDVYKGMVQITVFIPSPPDKDAFIEDFFKDALASGRGVGDVNFEDDAGTNSRILGEYEFYDAGTPDRDFTQN
jgi:hypothetical protein